MREPSRDHVDTCSGRVAYLRAGSGPSVVLVHGSLTTADDMTLALFEALSLEFDVIAFDRPGHGGSEKLAGDQGSPSVQAMALLEAMDMLGIAKPVVVGHSFGGAVALAFALDRPDEVAGVVALAPICFPEIRLEHALLSPRAIPIFGEAYATGFGRAADVAVLPLMRNAMFLPQIMPPSYRDAFPFAWASQPSAMMADACDGLAELRTLSWSALNYASCRSRVTILGGTHDLVVANARHGLVAASIDAVRLIPLGAGSGAYAASLRTAAHYRRDPKILCSIGSDGTRSGRTPQGARARSRRGPRTQVGYPDGTCLVMPIVAVLQASPLVH